MKKLIAGLERLLEAGGIKKDIVLLVISVRPFSAVF